MPRIDTAATLPQRRVNQSVLTVVSTLRLSPHLVRVQLGGDGFDDFIENAAAERLAATDTYVKLFFADPELGLEPPYDMATLRTTLTPAQMPSTRTYTVRSVDRSTRTIAIDFVVHGDQGLAGPWALRAQPGDTLVVSSPGGGFVPSPDATEYRLLGDLSALPAIAATLEAMPAWGRGEVVIEAEVVDRMPLLFRPGVALTWVTPEDVPGAALVREAAQMTHPREGAQVFAHGEREAMKALRPIVLDQWRTPRGRLSMSAYWAHGRAEDRFQSEKREAIGRIFED